MDPPPPPPSTSPRPPIPTPKLRLMCSYGGHIVPRPHDKSLFYAGGDTRIVAIDRRTTASSLSLLASHLSRSLFGNRPFLLRYQLPDEDLDSLISVVTDEDLDNMLEEHDRLTPPARIKLFLFPVKPESPDPKSESWFSDALKGVRVFHKGQSADCGLLLDFGSDHVDGLGGGGEGGKVVVGPESVVLETNSSFGSTESSLSMSNSVAVVGGCDDAKGLGLGLGLDLGDTNVKVPSSTSMESENSLASMAATSKTVVYPEPLIQIAPDAPFFRIEPENTHSDPAFSIPAQKTVQVLGYPLSDVKKQHHEAQFIQGGVQYVPQYTHGTMPFSPYYHPMYQMPMHPQHIPSNQPYSVYLLPVRPPTQYQNMPMQSDNSATISSSRPLLPPQTTVITQSQVAHKEVFGVPVAESATKGQLVVGVPEPQITSDPVTSAANATSTGHDFEEDIAYNPIYKTQPSLPVLPSQYETVTKGTTVMLPEHSVQLHQTGLHPQ